jgi:hypothetical protein
MKGLKLLLEKIAVDLNSFLEITLFLRMEEHQ